MSVFPWNTIEHLILIPKIVTLPWPHSSVINCDWCGRKKKSPLILGAKLSPGQSQFLHPQTSYAIYLQLLFWRPGSMLKHLTNNNSGVASNVHLIYANLIICAQKTINTNENICYRAHYFTCHYMQWMHITKWARDGRKRVCADSLRYRVVCLKPCILFFLGDIRDFFHGYFWL